MKRKEKIILGVLAVLLIVTIIGVSYAAFTFGQSGKNLNTVTTGIMQMSYEESSNVIKMTGALPTTDTTGKVRLNEGEYFDFTVSSTIQGDAQINWEIAAEDFSSNTFDGGHVKLYLTSLDSSGKEREVMAPTIFTKVTAENKKTGRPANMMSLATGTMSALTSTKYRLRMWVDENYNPQGDGGGKKFAVRINVYGKLYEGSTGSQMKTFAFDEYVPIDRITKIETKNTNAVPSTALESFDVSEAGNGSVVLYIESDETVVIAGKGGIVAPSDASEMFTTLENATSIDLTYLDTSKVTDVSRMFYNCSSLTSLDLSSFNTSGVTNMSDMFYNCSSLTSIDVSNFDTSKVTSMYEMFFGCISLTSLNLSNFDTSKVISMTGMFKSCIGLISLDVSNFDTSKVTSMDSMFYRCDNLANLDLSSFDTSKVTTMNGMFFYCSKMQSIKVSSKWVIGSGCNIGNMFNGCGVSSVTVV